MGIRKGQQQRAGGPRAARVLTAAVLAFGLALTSAACSKGGGGNAGSWKGGSSPEAPPPKASATITAPAADAKDVPASTDIAFTTQEAVDSKFELKDANGKVVKGKLSSDGKTWQPDSALDWGTTYTATVTATGDDGRPATVSNNFTTMAKPGKLLQVSSFLGDGQTVGVGMPLIVKFGRAVPESYRDDVQRRMSVKSTPSRRVPGAGSARPRCTTGRRRTGRPTATSSTS
ncbi:hypothetical protein GCM10027605_15490 [Micromonospora zhanjiangensis]